jgi:predicted N-acyltransferase
VSAAAAREREGFGVEEAPPGVPACRHPLLAARVAPSLAAVDATLWDGLLPPGNGALAHAYLRAWENAELPGLRSRPVLALDGTSVVGACPGYWYDLDLAGTRAPALGGILSLLRRRLPWLLLARTYELGSPTPLTNPFLVPDAHLRGPAVGALGAAALAEAGRGRAQFVLVQNLTSLDGPAASHLRPLGFTGVRIPPTVVVDLPYGSFEEYLGAMRSQYRRRARQALEHSEGLVVEHRAGFRELAGELAGLWRLVYERAKEVRREVLTPAYFRAVSEVPETSVLLLRRSDGTIASFALLLADPPWMTFLYCGFDAERGRSEGAYFRLLYEIVRLAIGGGFRQVELGITTIGPKLDVGGVPVPLYALVKHRNPLMHRAITLLAKGPLGPGDVAARHVFKEPPPTAAELVARRPLTL